MIHGEFFNAEVDIKKVKGKNKSGSEQGLIGVDDEGYIDDPSGKKAGEKFWEPHDETAGSNDGNPPEDSQVIKFFPIGPSVKLGLFPFTKEPFLMGNKVSNIL